MRTIDAAALLTGVAALLTLASCESTTDPAIAPGASPAPEARSAASTPSLEFRDLQLPDQFAGASRITAYSISPLGLRISGTVVRRPADPAQDIVAHWFTLRLAAAFGTITASEVGTESPASGRGINDLGDLVGFRTPAEGPDVPFVRLAGSLETTDWHLSGADRTAGSGAYGINDLRTVVGFYR